MAPAVDQAMKTRTIAMILAAAVTAGATASADPQAMPVAAGSRADVAPVRISPTTDHATTTRPPVTVDTRPGGVRIVVDNHDPLAGDDAVCLTAAGVCARTTQIDGRPVAEQMSAPSPP
jgi:hypothetical protein